MNSIVRTTLLVLLIGLLTSAAFAKARTSSRSKTVVFNVSGGCLCCWECFLDFKDPVASLPGVKNVAPKLKDSQAVVTYDPNVTSLYAISTAAKGKGYTIQAAPEKTAEPATKTAASSA